MRTKSVLIVSFLFMSFLILTSTRPLQDTETFEGTFDGHEDYGYNFIGLDEDKQEYTMTFQEIEKAALESFNLDSDDLIGTKFMVTYKTKKETVKDEDGYEEDLETYTILRLKTL
jgi:hypothetical protein